MIENIINSSAGLIWKIAKQFYNVDKNDLYQAGVLGVIKAYKHYQNERDVKFSTFAYKYIYGEMYLLANNREIKITKDILKLLKMIERGKMKLSQEIMREPTNKELALYLEIEEEKLNQVLMYASKTVSLDEVCDEARNLHEVVSLDESVPLDDKMLLNESINNLNKLEKDIIKSRYYEDLTQSETAKKLGITQVMVSRYEQKSLVKMREFMYM